MSDAEKEPVRSNVSLRPSSLAARIVLIGIVAAILISGLGRAREAVWRAGCEDNLMELRTSMVRYMDDNDGAFPSLSRVPGRFSPAREGYFPYYLHDPNALVCPANSTFPADDEAGAALNDHSYIYLGYTITDEEEGLAFLRAYEEKVTEAIDGKELVYDESRGEWMLPEEFWPDRLYVGEGLGTAEFPSLLRLDAGIPRFLITDIHGHSTYSPLSAIVVLADRPGTANADFDHKPGGANILFADGRTEFETYPSDKYILSPRFVEQFQQTEARVERLYSDFVAAQGK